MIITGKTEIEPKYEIITPKIAAEMLLQNTHNRKRSNLEVGRLTAQMKRGEWKLTHEGIAFAFDGRLIDGQTRLEAIVKSGVTLKMLVCRGLEFDEAFGAIDRGRKRTLSDSTQLPRPISDICALFGRLLTGTSVMISTDQALSICENGVGDLAEWLLLGSSKNTRIYSSAPVRTAAIILMLAGHDKNYIQDLYANLVNVRVELLPPIALSFYKQVHQGRIAATDKYPLVIRSLKVFDQTKKNSKILSIASDSVGNLHDLVRKVYYAQPNAKKIHAWNQQVEPSTTYIRSPYNQSKSSALQA